jgi:hypothetical protein
MVRTNRRSQHSPALPQSHGSVQDGYACSGITLEHFYARSNQKPTPSCANPVGDRDLLWNGMEN